MFSLRNPDNAEHVIDTPSEDRRDFLLERGWTLVSGEAPAPATSGGVIEDAWLQEAIARGAVRSSDDVLTLPDVHLEDEIDEAEAEEHERETRKGRR